MYHAYNPYTDEVTDSVETLEELQDSLVEAGEPLSEWIAVDDETGTEVHQQCSFWYASPRGDYYEPCMDIAHWADSYCDYHLEAFGEL